MVQQDLNHAGGGDYDDDDNMNTINI